MDVSLYFKRLKIDYEIECSFSHLCKLQRSHVYAVIFENLDIIKRKPLSLKIEDIFEKIVIQERGGVCFELNGLFNFLLQALGFDAFIVAATVVCNEEEPIENAHLTNIVKIDGNLFLVDVGYGVFTPMCLVPICGDIASDAMTDYRIRNDAESGEKHLLLEHKRNEEWVTLYKFNLKPKCLKDFEQPLEHVQNGPNSLFVKNVFVSKICENERWRLFGRTLLHYTKHERSDTEIDENHLSETLQKYFQISPQNCVSSYPT
ncbi:acetyltransferase-like protein [Dinothrombium tinctorium]|uniref:arylamine N-acetyltransferase n=1 Tax=Dinothrombium tinctorium TaxID=1965070 RepID=A0A443R1U9_9ACAR|nr:acetyltransferase-like protein [Dinothrombium tinctorium]